MTTDMAPESPADPGMHALEKIRSFLQVEDEWSSRMDRGFAWWGWLQAQVVAAAPVRTVASGVCGSQVIVFTDLGWCDELTKESIAHLWDLSYRTGAGGGPYLDSSPDGKVVVRLAATAFVHEGMKEQMGGLLALAASFQLFSAAKEAPLLDAIGLRPLVSARPDGTPRHSPAEAVLAVAELVGETPEGENAWRRQAEFDATAEVLREELGIDCAVRDHFLSALLPSPGGRECLVTAQASDGHPDFGSGLALTTHTQREIRPDAPRDHLLPLLMNRTELGDEGGPVAFGSWCAAPSPLVPEEPERLFLTHTSFWPSFTFAPGLLPRHLAMHSVGRARRAGRWIESLSGSGL